MTSRQRFARTTQPKTGMNNTEAKYAREVLDIRVLSGEVTKYLFQSIKFRIGENCW